MAIIEGRPQPEVERPNWFCPLPEGVTGISITLNQMVRLTKYYKGNLVIRDTAERIIAHLPEKDYWAEAAAIHEWVRDNVRYTRDPDDLERLATPVETLRSMQGDCDDKATLVGALLASIGAPVRYVAIGTSGVPDQFDHVYAEFKLGRDKWVSVETTEPVSLGWKPENVSAYMVRHV